MMLDIDEAEVGPIEVHANPPERTAGLLEILKRSEATAAEAAATAHQTRLEAVILLRAEGLAMRDIGRLLGLSHQRISQILDEAFPFPSSSTDPRDGATPTSTSTAA
jgi:DNA-directed RNA polymerase specialized sigma24 family protein